MHKEIDQEVFRIGLKNIEEKYISELSIQTITLSAINGLSSIDPDVKAKSMNNKIILYFKGKKIKSWKVENDTLSEWISILTEAIKMAQETSQEIQTVEIEEIYKSVFNNILPGLDHFSRYAGAKEAAQNRTKREGFIGIGIDFKIDEKFMLLTEIRPNSPAEKANLKIGDRISHINGILVKGLTHTKISDQLSGPIMTDVTFQIERELPIEPLIVQVTRERIVPTSVTEKHRNGILYFKIANFNQNTASSLSVKIASAIKKLRHIPKGMIVDLRGNPGGLLKQSVKVADIFLSKGDIVSTSGRHPESLNKYTASSLDLSSGLPLIVLIDGQSASAAEILAAALQDHNRAVIIGSSSFGKGTVQTVIRLPNKGELTLTWSEFVAPSGYRIQGKGVLPVICTNRTDIKTTNLIRDTILSMNEFKSTFRLWRTSDNRISSQKKVQHTCPPKRHISNYDIEVAEQLLKTPKDYQTTLALASLPKQKGHEK